MSNIGLYDLDLWHFQRATPNLELMKVFNYHYQKGDQVIMLKPKDETGRFSKVIYFKDNVNFSVPRSVSVTGENKTFYGFGFYNKFKPLPEQYQAAPPSYLPYDAFSDKLKMSVKYDKVKRESIVRVKNGDFTGYKADSKKIFIVDHNFCYDVPNAFDFLQEYKQKDYYFFHTLEAKDIETFNKLERYLNIIKKTVTIGFDFDVNFFKEYYRYCSFRFGAGEGGVINLVKSILYCKSKNTCLLLPRIENSPLNRKILEWNLNRNQQSYYEFFNSDPAAIKAAEQSPTEIRLLLKTRPSSQIFDLN